MSKLKVLSPAMVELATIHDTLSCARKEVINGENTLNFETFLTTEHKSLINKTNLIELDTDYFDIASYHKGQETGGRLYVSAACEHISNRLNRKAYDLEYFTETGTPEEILGKLLEGTGFTVGTVEFSETETYSIQEKKSRRACVVQFTEYLGGELSFLGFTVSILAHRGSNTPKDLMADRNIDVLSEDVDKTTLDAEGNPSVSYELTLIQPMALSLGDVVTLVYEPMDIDITLRIISITTDPYNDDNISFAISNTVPAMEDAAYRIETETVRKDARMNGVRIGPTYGYECVTYDNFARSYFNASNLAMQQGDGSGSNWVNVIYFDPAAKKYKITGDVQIEGQLASDADFTDSLYAEQGDISQLTVDWLKASNRLWKYLNDDFTDDNFVEIHGPYIRHITAKIKDPHVEIQLQNRYGDLLYWNGDITAATLNADGWPEIDGTRLYTKKTESEWPVMVYEYSETVKLGIGFRQDPGGSGFDIPMIELGAGTGTGDNGKGFVYKGLSGLYLDYYSSVDGSLRRIILGDDGIVLTPYGLNSIDFYPNGFNAVYDGETVAYTWTKDESGRITSLITEDMVTIPVTRHAEDM